MERSVSRREFFERTAFAAATLAVVRRGQAAPTGMSISLNGSLAPGVEWPELARLAARVGYSAVDVSLGGAREAGVDRTRALFAELKIAPAIVNLPFRLTGPEEDFKKGLNELDEVTQFLTNIECPRMMAVLSPASRTPKTEQRKIVRDRLSAISEILAPSNIRLGLEFLGPMYMRTRQPHEFIWRMDETLALAKDSGPNIGLVLDAWHWHHAGASDADILAAGKSRIVHVHVSDAKQQPPEEVRDNQRLMPGEGIIDLMAFFHALATIEYTDAVSPEPLGRVPEGMSAEEGARLGLETTRRVMDAAGV